MNSDERFKLVALKTVEIKNEMNITENTNNVKRAMSNERVSKFIDLTLV